MVNIQHEGRQLPAVVFRLLNGDFCDLHETPAVQKAGQGIGIGHHPIEISLPAGDLHLVEDFEIFDPPVRSIVKDLFARGVEGFEMFQGRLIILLFFIDLDQALVGQGDIGERN